MLDHCAAVIQVIQVTPLIKATSANPDMLFIFCEIQSVAKLQGSFNSIPLAASGTACMINLDCTSQRYTHVGDNRETEKDIVYKVGQQINALEWHLCCPGDSLDIVPHASVPPSP